MTLRKLERQEVRVIMGLAVKGRSLERSCGQAVPRGIPTVESENHVYGNKSIKMHGKNIINDTKVW